MEIFQVGGSIRDELLGVIPNDRDWVVVGSSPKKMEEMGFKPIGKDFPVFLHPQTKEEYALARTEKKSGVGYKGFNFYCGEEVTIEDDLKRRDFTINAIAKNTAGDLIDPFGGAGDIKHKIFKHVSNAFSEDPLRALRLARFKTYAHLQDFSVASSTLALLDIISHSKELASLSADRIWMEVQRALSNPYSQNFFYSLLEYSLQSPWFDSLKVVSCEESSPTLKWAELQRANGFSLGANLPVPKSYTNAAEALMKVLEIVDCSIVEEKLLLIEALNVPRNYDELMIMLSMNILKDQKRYIEDILTKTNGIDFQVLAQVDHLQVSERKHLLYYDALHKLL